MKSISKNQSIKIRVTKQEKEQLKKLAGSSKSMSAYMLAKSLSTDSICQESVIDTIEKLDFTNAIIREVEKSTDELLKKSVKEILIKAIHTSNLRRTATYSSENS